mgnify:CR=1 FL=1
MACRNKKGESAKLGDAGINSSDVFTQKQPDTPLDFGVLGVEMSD